MTPREQNSADAMLQSAALRHYAVKCRDKAALIRCGREKPNLPECGVEWLEERATRADKLADSYDRLSVALCA